MLLVCCEHTCMWTTCELFLYIFSWNGVHNMLMDEQKCAQDTGHMHAAKRDRTSAWIHFTTCTFSHWELASVRALLHRTTTPDCFCRTSSSPRRLVGKFIDNFFPQSTPMQHGLYLITNALLAGFTMRIINCLLSTAQTLEHTQPNQTTIFNQRNPNDTYSYAITDTFSSILFGPQTAFQKIHFQIRAVLTRTEPCW